MSLNINYQGNVVDKDGNIIDCKYQAYSSNIDKWSDIRSTDKGQYNINYGDGDLNTQSGSVSEGDALIVVFWTGGDTRDDKEDLFSSTVFIYDGNDNTVQDVQLIPPRSPGCDFILPPEALIYEDISSISKASTTYQWTYSGKTFYQRRIWYGQTIFGFLDIQSDSYDFGNGDTSGNSTKYDNSGDYTVTHTVLSTYGLSSECQKSIRIKYHQPIGGISFSNSSPIVGESFNIIASIADVDNRITNIVHRFNNTVIDNNTDVNYSYSTSAESLGTYYAEQIIYWNDGFSDNNFVYKKAISIANQPPSINLTVEQDSLRKEIFVANANATDIDGAVSSICWELYYMSTISELPDPFFRCKEEQLPMDYKLIYRGCGEDKQTIEMAYSIPGKYRIKVVATDDYGDSTEDFKDITVTEICDSVFGECPDCPEYTPEKDCADKIAIAVRELKIQLLNEMDKKTRTVVVQDSRVSGVSKGELYGKIDGDISEGELAGELSSSIGGEVGSGMASGSIGSGSVNGKIKR